MQDPQAQHYLEMELVETNCRRLVSLSSKSKNSHRTETHRFKTGCRLSYSYTRGCRHLQIGCYVAAFALGFLVFIPLGQIVKEYKIMGCILFADVSYVLSDNGTLEIVPEKSRFGRDWDCDFCMYAPVLSSIHSFIWCWFIVLFSRTSELDPQKARQILLPSLVFDFLMCICCCCSASLLTRGFWDLCSSIERGKLSRCDRADTFEWRGVRFVFSKVFQSCSSAKICSWLLTATWATLIVITLVRIVLEYKQGAYHSKHVAKSYPENTLTSSSSSHHSFHRLQCLTSEASKCPNRKKKRRRRLMIQQEAVDGARGSIEEVAEIEESQYTRLRKSIDVSLVSLNSVAMKASLDSNPRRQSSPVLPNTAPRDGRLEARPESSCLTSPCTPTSPSSRLPTSDTWPRVTFKDLVERGSKFIDASSDDASICSTINLLHGSETDSRDFRECCCESCSPDRLATSANVVLETSV